MELRQLPSRVPTPCHKSSLRWPLCPLVLWLPPKRITALSLGLLCSTSKFRFYSLCWHASSSSLSEMAMAKELHFLSNTPSLFLQGLHLYQCLFYSYFSILPLSSKQPTSPIETLRLTQIYFSQKLLFSSSCCHLWVFDLTLSITQHPIPFTHVSMPNFL